MHRHPRPSSHGWLQPATPTYGTSQPPLNPEVRHQQPNHTTQRCLTCFTCGTLSAPSSSSSWMELTPFMLVTPAVQACHPYLRGLGFRG